MNDQERRFWPFRPRTSIAAALLILFLLLLTIAILRVTIDWPSQDSEKTVLLGILLLSLLPIVLALVDAVIERGGVVKFRDLEIDFSQAQKVQVSGITVPANIGVAGQSVTDSSTTEILDALKQAMSSDIVIIDLEEGQAWWETRLLVLLAGAVRLQRPETVVFVGTDGGTDKCFQGWGSASKLLPHLLQAHPQYALSYHSAMAAARQWETVEPQGPSVQPPPPAWMEPGLATQHSWMAFDFNTGLPNRFFAEQLLASDLGDKVEQTEPPKTISLVRLEELFRPVLHKESVEETWPDERQINEFFDSDAPYIGITRNGQYKALVSRMSVLNTILGTVVARE